MQVGDLQDYVALDENQAVTGPGGSAPPVWVEVAQGAAKVQPLRGREQVTAEKERARTLYKVWMPRRAINSGWRLRWLSNGGVEMNVREVLDHGPRDLFIEFIAETGVPA